VKFVNSNVHLFIIHFCANLNVMCDRHYIWGLITITGFYNVIEKLKYCKILFLRLCQQISQSILSLACWLGQWWCAFVPLPMRVLCGVSKWLIISIRVEKSTILMFKNRIAILLIDTLPISPKPISWHHFWSRSDQMSINSLFWPTVNCP